VKIDVKEGKDYLVLVDCDDADEDIIFAHHSRDDGCVDEDVTGATENCGRVGVYECAGSC
jgi:hypothetical protein